MHNSQYDRIIYFIINLNAGNGKGKKLVPIIEHFLVDNKINYRFIYTKYKGHAIEIARNLKDSSDEIKLIVAVGGDGTLFEVVNGAYPIQIPLGYIPAGTGNDFARAMGISKDPIEALKKILDFHVKELDLGLMNHSYFINVSGMGFDGEVTRIANQSNFKKYLGKLVYVYGIIKALMSYNPKEVELTIDGKSRVYKDVWLIAVANNKYFGGGMMISPNSISDDGYLDVIVVKDINRFQLLRLFPTIFYGGHIHFRMVDVLKGQEIEIRSNETLTVQTDGEIFEYNQLYFKNIPKGLKIVN